MHKKIGILLTVLILFCFSVANASSMFSDVKGTEWFYKDVYSLVELGSISGYTDGTFRPLNKVSRAEFVKILITAIGEKPGNPTGHWASGYISKAEELGLISKGAYHGKEADKIITRNEIAKIASLADSMIFEGMQASKSEPIIKDMSLIPTEYKDHVKNVYSKGIITGFPDGRFGGNEGLSRAEASVVTLRLIRPEKRVVVSVDNGSKGEDNKHTEIETPVVDEVVNVEDFIVIDGKVINKLDVVEELKAYSMDYPREHFETKMAAEPNNTGFLRILQNMDYLHNTVNSYMNNMFNRDYSSINSGELKTKSLKAVQDWWYYKNIRFSPEEYFDEWVKDTKAFNIKQQAYFVTDPSLIHLVERDGFRVRGRLYFKYDAHNNPSNIQYELETNDRIEVGKWYSVDIDIRCLNVGTNAPIVDKSGYGGICNYDSSYYLNKLTEFK